MSYIDVTGKTEEEAIARALQQLNMDSIVKRLDEILGPSQSAADPQKQPNVIFILSESFYDITRLPGLTLSADPAENYHRLSKEGISGRFYTGYLGYGTGYIEQSIFSGLTGKDLKPGTNICFRDPGDYSLLDSIVTPFKTAGYETELLHSYNSSLYNRTVTYPRIGFDHLLFSAQMQALDLNIQGSPYAGGYYLSDHDNIFIFAITCIAAGLSAIAPEIKKMPTVTSVR